MSSSITAIVLDGHPAAFSGTTRDHDPSVDRTQNLPPIPLWTCMVDGTLEFCRIGWETASNQLPEITVIAAGKQPQYLISAGQAGQVDTLVEQLKEVQPRQTTPVDRIQNALISFFEIAQTARYRTLRIVLMLLDKGSGTRYSYSNNEGSEARDIRAMLYDSFKESTSFDSIHVDVLRIFPRTDNLPPNVENNTFAPSATLSVYNIPNHMDALKSAMRNLAQLYYNVDILRITNIPMNVRRQDSSTAMTQTVELYAQCTESCKARHHIHMQAQNDTRMPIHDPRYLRSKVINLVYVKRNKRVVHDMRWCACRHSVTVLVDDGPTKAYLGTIRQGSVSYLMDPENIKANKEWTHILISDHDKVYLHVFDHQLEHKLEEESQTLVAKSKVKTEYSMMGALSSYPLITPDKVQEFTQTFIVPNMYPDILSDLPPTQKFKAFKYSSESPLLSVLSKNIQTTENIELTTRWLTCFRDCMGTDKFPVTLEDNRPISDFAAEVCNGSPLHSGFGLLPTLNLPLSASLNKIKNAVFSKDRSLIRPTIGEVDMMVSQLSAVAVGKSSKMISNFKMLKEDSRLMAKRLLIALYLVGKRFMDNAGGKKCQVILPSSF
ncbi:hypothetical protein BDB00DRAFT_184371 [Zychaea mexicana]|uniref:uncharacterized protein n=1 Tax=Zychaea mexicana TaxID=64656 RepID=UPI0022FEF6C0|nr:uncharacterized protein BDB00DRAFT_184371 [Zychaea mexicana]KAI9479483.1 hypothetical protein BDB00DRAFT_184371 [Zychaea mexicana]